MAKKIKIRSLIERKLLPSICVEITEEMVNLTSGVSGVWLGWSYFSSQHLYSPVSVTKTMKVTHQYFGY